MMTMKKTLLITVILIVFSCNFKKDHASSKILNSSPKKELQKKLSGKEVVTQLEKLTYFKLTAPSDLDTVKLGFENNYNKLHFFQGPMQEETLLFLDHRYYWIDCETLFEIDGLTLYLKQVRRTFEKLNLVLEFANEKSDQDQNYWKHTIELNGIEYIAYEGTFSDLDWAIAYVNFIEMLNAALRKQGSQEQFYPINCGNTGSFVLLSPQQFDFVSKHYPNDNEHPTTLSAWKSIFDL